VELLIVLVPPPLLFVRGDADAPSGARARD
jgi:hypothetical protein